MDQTDQSPPKDPISQLVDNITLDLREQKTETQTCLFALGGLGFVGAVLYLRGLDLSFTSSASLVFILPLLLTWTLVHHYAKPCFRWRASLVLALAALSLSVSLFLGMGSLGSQASQIFSPLISILVGTIALGGLFASHPMHLPLKGDLALRGLLTWQLLEAVTSQATPLNHHGLWALILIVSFPFLFRVLVKIRTKALLRKTQLFPNLSRTFGLRPLLKGELIPRVVSLDLAKNNQYEGKDVWFIFYRYAACPLCLMHLSELILRKSQLQAANIEVIAVFQSQDNELSTLRNLVKDSPIQVLSNPTNDLYEGFGVTKSWKGFFHPKTALELARATWRGHIQGKVTGHLAQMPAHFLFNKKQELSVSFYGKHAADHLAWSQVDPLIESRAL